MKRLSLLAVITGGLLLQGSAGLADSNDGARRWTRTVKKQSEVVYKIVFNAEKNPNKQNAEFAVIGDGSTDVDIYVFDAEGKEVAKDTFFTDLALVRWIPAKTQEYTIKVRNLGNADNTCTMGHN
jgi:molecular chaperone DnaK (HSP70)